MNKWYFLSLACFLYCVLTPMLIGHVYGWNTTSLELPFIVMIVDVLSLLVGGMGFLIFGIAAIMKDRYG